MNLTALISNIFIYIFQKKRFPQINHLRKAPHIPSVHSY